MATKLLLVEDSLSIQTIVETTFAREGFDVSVVSDALDGLQKVHTVHPDIVLADASMPGIDGFQLCQRIRQSANGRDVPVVLLTSGFSTYDEAKGARSGVTTYLAKPFEPRVLLELVKQLVAATPPPAFPMPDTTMATLLPRPNHLSVQEAQAVLPPRGALVPMAEPLEAVWPEPVGLPDLAGLAPWDHPAPLTQGETTPALPPGPQTPAPPAMPMAATLDGLAYTLGRHLLQHLQETLEAQMAAVCAQLIPQMVTTVREVAQAKMPELLAVLLQEEIDKLKHAAEHGHHGD